LVLWSYGLGAVNLLVLALAFAGRKQVAALTSVGTQGPWDYYDVTTHQPGFLLTSAGSLVICAITLWKCHRKPPEK
jgi:hypothetical protein